MWIAEEGGEAPTSIDSGLAQILQGLIQKDKEQTQVTLALNLPFMIFVFQARDTTSLMKELGWGVSEGIIRSSQIPILKMYLEARPPPPGVPVPSSPSRSPKYGSREVPLKSALAERLGWIEQRGAQERPEDIYDVCRFQAIRFFDFVVG